MSLSLEERAALKRDIFASLHCALPGIVESFDAEKGRADIRPALLSRLPGTADIRPYPILRDVPVFLPRFSDPSPTLQVSPGDPCLLIFSDAALDGCLSTGEPALPHSARMHDLSDAFALVGFRFTS